MKAKTKLFSLILLFLLILCSLTSVYGEDITDASDHSNLTENIIEEITTESEINNDKNNLDELNLDESSLDEPNSKENIRKSNLNLKEEYNSNEQTKSFTELYIEILTNPNNLTLTNDYMYNPEKDQDLTRLPITEDNYILDGQGHTINGNALTSIFIIMGENVTLKNIQIINGKSAENQAVVHFMSDGIVDNCTFTNNYGAGKGILSFEKTGVLINSNFYNNTAINHTTVNFASDGLINNCKFSHNIAKQGAAIYFKTGGTVSNSKFENNYANTGGAIYGSTITSQNDINIKNCQFINNSAETGGAIYNSFGNIIIDNCEFTLNHANDGGAVFGSYGITIKNSNFTSNHAEGNGGAIYVTTYGELYSNNFTGNTATGLGKSIYSDILVSNLNTFENDETIEIYSRRTFDSPVVFVDANVVNTGDGSAIKPWKTLSEALENNDTENIIVAEGTYNGQGNVGLRINTTRNIYAMGQVIFDGEGKSFIFNISSYVYIEGVTFKNGFGVQGGAISSSTDSILFINNSSFINNKAEYNGGAIYTQGYLDIINSSFKGNTQFGPESNTTDGEDSNDSCTDCDDPCPDCGDEECDGDTQGGGAITGTFPSSTIIIKECIFDQNSAVSGGAIQAAGFSYIDNSTFTNNHAKKGGAIRSYVTSTLLFSQTGSKFISNRAKFGGAISLAFINAPVYNLYFENNIAEDGAGGAIYGLFLNSLHEVGSEYRLHLCNCTFKNNKASTTILDAGVGGAIAYAIANDDAIICLDGCNFTGNSAFYGGAIYSKGTIETIGNPTYFTNNEANSVTENNTIHMSYGGAIMHYRDFDFNATVYFEYNSASSGCGGAIASCEIFHIPSTIKNAVFIDNSCKDGMGGAIYANHNCTIINCEFEGNYAWHRNKLDHKKDSKGGTIGADDENVHFTIINNNFIDMAGKYGPYEYGWGVYNDIGLFKLQGNYYTEKNGKHDVLGALTGAIWPTKIFEDPYPIHTKWNLSSDLSQLVLLLTLSEDGSTINLDKDYLLDYNGTYNLTLSKSITIDGQGHSIRGNFAKNLCIKLNGDIQFENIIFEELNEFITINNNSNYSFINCTFSNNAGENNGIITVYDNGTCNIINSTFNNNSAYKGGAITVYDNGTCNLINSIFSSNYASISGGAIYSENKVYVQNCLFDSNKVNLYINLTSGGAIYSKSLTTVNCTFNNNAAKFAGGAIFTANIIPHNTTFTNNTASYGGAIFIKDHENEGFLEITGNTFIGNSANEEGGAICIIDTDLPLKLNLNRFIDNIASLGYAVYSSSDFCDVIFNQWGGSAVDFTYDPILVKASKPFDIYFEDSHPLDDWDENTFTFPLISLQKDLNLGINIVLTHNYAYDENYDSVFGLYLIGKNLVIDGQGHYLDGKAMAKLLNVQSSNVTLKNMIFLNGYADKGGAISGQNLNLLNCTFINNKADKGGAAHIMDSKLVNCTFINNSASESGGAINLFAFIGSEISHCTFINNSAVSDGGALIVNSNVTIEKSRFEGNHALNGGAIFFSNYGTILDSYFTNNIALSHGGALYSKGNLTFDQRVNFNDNFANGDYNDYYLEGNATITILEIKKSFSQLKELIENSKDSYIILENNYQYMGSIDSDTLKNGINITRESLTIDGDGYILNAANISKIFKIHYSCIDIILKNIIFLNGNSDYGSSIHSASPVKLINCTFINNHADIGGALYGEFSDIINCTFINNSAEINGGAGYLVTCENLINCSFINNSAESSGGAMLIDNNKAHYNIAGCDFINNTARNGGALMINLNAEITKSLFEGNYAHYGGAVFAKNNSNSYIDNCAFNKNAAEIRGGGIFCEGNLTLCNDVIFEGNTASRDPDYSATDVQFITKNEPKLTIYVSLTYKPISVLIEIGTVKNFTGILPLDLANETYMVNITGGYGNITIEGLGEGNYTATVSFKDIKGYYERVKSIDFEIPISPRANLSIEAHDFSFGSSGLIEIRVNETITGLIPIQIIKINDSENIIRKNYVVVHNGYGKLTLDNLDIGEYNITAYFQSTSVFIHDENASAIFRVYALEDSNRDSSLDVNSLNSAVASSSNNDVGLLNAVAPSFSNETGEGSVSSNVSNFASSVHVLLDPKLKITVSNITVGKNAQIKITTDSKFSGNVNVKIGSKIYTVKVSDGKGNKIIKGLKVGAYKAIASFSKTKTYKASTKSVGFKVKPHVIKLSLNNLKVRKSAKRLIIKASLKIDGKKAIGKKLIFQFKGKKQIAKTDKNGIAKLIIGKNLLKKITLGKVFTYQVSYSKKTVRKTVKIQR